MNIRSFAEAARQASRSLACTSTEIKHAALEAMAGALSEHQSRIEEANREDCREARDAALPAPLLKRLSFERKHVGEAVEGLRALLHLPEPVGRVLSRTALDEGLELTQETCPIGVIGVIFESRPDALVQISALCLKSGNAVLLKGGREASRTNRVLADIIRTATESAGIPAGWMHLLETRADVAAMLSLDDCIDLVIPRGSNAFVRHIMETSRIPVMGHADGLCHVYVDAEAEAAMALSVVEDSKCQYTAVCNAAETLLVHAAIADRFLPQLRERMNARNVELRGCSRTVASIGGAEASEEDWRTEYLDAILSVKVVESLQEAVDHIHRYGSGHTEAIVTENPKTAETFLDAVDSGNVFWNASTRFADGFRYGLGAEVGISTSKLHARGPVGLEGLLSYKWKLRGNGQTVAPYAEGRNRFLHRRF